MSIVSFKFENQASIFNKYTRDIPAAELAELVNVIRAVLLDIQVEGISVTYLQTSHHILFVVKTLTFDIPIHIHQNLIVDKAYPRIKATIKDQILFGLFKANTDSSPLWLLPMELDENLSVLMDND